MIGPGSRLAHYEIVSALGKGGMGEVWRARDTKLGREVAIKTLPPEFAEDADRLARFEREAKVLASLNHPNIAAIYGLEEHEGSRVLVLELVEGDTLGDRIKQGPIPVEESLKLALQIADALKAAHESGVIHRDLKPDNIKVSEEDNVKVLDFGLAKALSGEESDVNVSNSPTLSMAATQAGVILGTAAYMSPEQAKGRPVDRRADIWAFGCVLFEMLTGRQSFGKSDVTESLAAAISLQPDWDALPSNVHPRLRELVERCLQKRAADRCQDIGDVRYELTRILADPANTGPPIQESRLSFSWKLTLAATVVAAAIGAVLVWVTLPRPADPDEVAYVAIALPPGQQLGSGFNFMSPVAVSSNGDVAYVAVREGIQQLFVKSLNSREAGRPLPGTEGATGPFFSPDGNSLGFFAGSALKTVEVAGGRPRDLITLVPNSRGGTWGPDGDIIFSGNSGIDGLSRIPGSGGEPEPVTNTEGGRLIGAHRFPQYLPGGTAIVYTVGAGGSWDDALIVAKRLEGDDQTEKVLISGGSDARYVPGHLVFVREGSLWAVPFDPDRLEVGDGDHPVEILTGVMQPTENTGAAFLGVSDAALVYIPGDFKVTDRQLVWIDRAGEPESLEVPTRPFASLSLCPDGQQVALEIDLGVEQRIWRHDASRPFSLSPLPSVEGSSDQRPTCRFDGSVSYISAPGQSDTNIVMSGEGRGTLETVLSMDFRVVEHDWSDDGTLLVFDGYLEESDYNIWLWEVSEETEPEVIINTAFNEQNPKLSADGNWLAYYSDESGRGEIYLTALLDDRTEPISTGGSDVGLAWGPGNELFYLEGNTMMGVAIQTEPNLVVGAPLPLFETPFPVLPYFEVSSDGERFLMIQAGEQHHMEIGAIFNWATLLNDRLP